MVEQTSSSHHRAPVEQPPSNRRVIERPSSSCRATVEQLLDGCSMAARRVLDGDCSTVAQPLLGKCSLGLVVYCSRDTWIHGYLLINFIFHNLQWMHKTQSKMDLRPSKFAQILHTNICCINIPDVSCHTVDTWQLFSESLVLSL